MPPLILQRLADLLDSRAPLEPGARAAIFALPYEMRSVRAGGYLAREGEAASRCWFLLSGFAYRSKTASDGARQVVALHFPGTLVDFQPSLPRTVEALQALTAVHAAAIPLEAMRKLARSSPAVMEALWIETGIEAATAREWIVNVGRRNARARLAHFVCELALREAGTPPRSCELPMTQDQIADALGLTPVHVNRTLQALEADGLIRRCKRIVTIPDWAALCQEGDFRPAYLQLDERRARLEAVA